MIHDSLRRGVLAGLVGGLAYGAYVALVANPLLAYIHDAAGAHDHGHGDAGHGGAGHDHGGAVEGAGGHDAALAVSETTEAVVSVGSAVCWGVLLGGIFAVAYYLLEPALPGRDGAKAGVLAAAGFVSVSVVPWLVLPPAAPGAEATLGVRTRLAIYLGLIALGALVSAASMVGYRRVAPAGRARALAVGAVPLVLTVVVLQAVAPTIVTHPGVADDLVAAFRGATVLGQAALWATIAATFVHLQGRADAPATASRSRSDEDPLTAPQPESSRG